MRQDPSHPTGVVETSSSLQVETVAARERKADAAVDMYVNKDKTLKQIARKLGYPTEVMALAAIEKRMQEHLRFHPRSTSAMREMAGRRLERLLRGVMAKADNPDDPEHLNAVTVARGVIGDWTKLYGVQAPTQVVVSNPTTEAIEARVHEIISQGAPKMTEGDIFGDDADDSEILELERRRQDAAEDIVDAVIVEDAVKELDGV